MAFSLHPAGLEDVEDIATIWHVAFKDDAVIARFHPNSPPHLVKERDIKYFTEGIKQGNVYGARFTKVFEEHSGKTVAFAKWDYPYTLTAEHKREKEEKNKDRPEAVEGSNGPLMDEFFRQLEEGRKRWLKHEDMFFLHILAVDPAYQRQGLGSMLIRPGLEAADKAGAKTYIEASSKGLGLYLKHGWEPVDEMVIDMGKYGGGKVVRQKFLMREPNAPNELGMEVE